MQPRISDIQNIVDISIKDNISSYSLVEIIYPNICAYGIKLVQTSKYQKQWVNLWVFSFKIVN
ncbi:MAG: hypothetical protein LBF36_03810 [Mycoplasmataceae bacterium]|nr:hypothetical protein [Mycoplasmataceae bacterium]